MPFKHYRKPSFRLHSWLLLLVWLLLPSMNGYANVAAAPDDAMRDPLRCWWRTSHGAVRSGETFELVLTCAVLDSPSSQAVVDESRLAGSTLALAPFDIVGSAHPRDLRNGQRRFFQYRYTLRLINPDAIGKDVPLPPIVLNYRLDSRSASGEIVEGRALNYLLPALSMRILSLVPTDAVGIRDTPDADFFFGEQLEQRANMLEILAVTLAVLGGLLLLALLSRWLFRLRRTTDDAARLLDKRQLFAASQRELAAVARAASAAWHDDLVVRAQAAIRIAAACVLDRTVHQTPTTGTAPAAGQLPVSHAHGKPDWFISAAVTGEQLAEAIAALPDTSPRKTMLAQLHDALTILDRAQYSTGDAFDRGALDSALAAALAAIRNIPRTWTRNMPWRRLSFGGNRTARA